MTVTVINSGTLNIGDRLFGVAGEVASGTTIIALGTGTGGIGTYTINTPQTVSSNSIYARQAVINCNNVSNCFSGTGSISAFSGTGSIAGSVLTISSVSSGTLYVGSVITGSNITSNTKIASFGTGSGLAGTYILLGSQNVTTTPTIKANTLNVTAVTGGALSVGDTLSGNGLTAGTFISSLGSGLGGAGTYNILPSQNVASTIIMAAPTAKLFRGSKTPSTILSGAEICGGICAFFDTTTLTQFNIVRNTNNGGAQWSAGFMCLSGVNITPTPIVSSAVTANSWSEPPQ